MFFPKTRHIELSAGLTGVLIHPGEKRCFFPSEMTDYTRTRAINRCSQLHQAEQLSTRIRHSAAFCRCSPNKFNPIKL